MEIKWILESEDPVFCPLVFGGTQWRQTLSLTIVLHADDLSTEQQVWWVLRRSSENRKNFNKF